MKYIVSGNTYYVESALKSLDFVESHKDYDDYISIWVCYTNVERHVFEYELCKRVFKRLHIEQVATMLEMWFKSDEVNDIFKEYGIDSQWRFTESGMSYIDGVRNKITNMFYSRKDLLKHVVGCLTLLKIDDHMFNYPKMSALEEEPLKIKDYNGDFDEEFYDGSVRCESPYKPDTRLDELISMGSDKNGSLKGSFIVQSSYLDKMLHS